MKHIFYSISLFFLLFLTSASSSYAADPFQLIDLNNSGAKASPYSEDVSAMTKDGNYVLFLSAASNMGVANGVSQLFLRNRLTNTTELVSIMPDGSQKPSLPTQGFVSSDGRYVSFADTESIYLRDRQLQTTSIIFTGSIGGFRYMTPDTRYYIIRDREFIGNIWLFDRQTGTYEALGVSTDGTSANKDVNDGVLSDDGRYAVFSTSAALVPDDTNATYDVYIRDRISGTTSILFYGMGNIIPNNQSGAAHISGDGRYVVYSSAASNLISGDTNGQYDVFLVDRLNMAIERVSLTSAGAQTLDFSDSPRVSDDGRYVIFTSQSVNLNSYNSSLNTVHLRDRALAKTELIGQNPYCKAVLQTTHNVYVSNDGRYVSLATLGKASALDLSDNSMNIYVRDRTVAFGKLASRCR